MEMIIIKSEEEMLQFSRRIAKKVSAGTVIFLTGDLGVGKTFFSRGFIRELCGEDVIVRSPTFSLLQTYDDKLGRQIFHYDFYRLKDSEEIYHLDIERALEVGIVLIEWPQVAGELLEQMVAKQSGVSLMKIHIELAENGSDRVVNIS